MNISLAGLRLPYEITGDLPANHPFAKNEIECEWSNETGMRRLVGCR